MLVCFVVIDGYTALLVLGDLIIPTTTIEVTNQSEDIVAKVKEQFNINYEIKKIEYSRGFPDGYSLYIYDVNGDKHEEFDDTFNVAESDKIQQYFMNLKPDSPKYLRLFEVELIIEFFVIAVMILFNISKNRKKLGKLLISFWKNGLAPEWRRKMKIRKQIR